jgi:hypothetical protein
MTNRCCATTRPSILGIQDRNGALRQPYTLLHTSAVTHDAGTKCLLTYWRGHNVMQPACVCVVVEYAAGMVCALPGRSEGSTRVDALMLCSAPRASDEWIRRMQFVVD